VGTGLVGAPACGDVMKLQIKVDDDGKIIDAKFKTFGCGSAIASSSLATEWVKGKSVSILKHTMSVFFCIDIFSVISIFLRCSCWFHYISL
jgi:NifU-like protein involved in Fe-S cluster formation